MKPILLICITYIITASCNKVSCDCPDNPELRSLNDSLHQKDYFSNRFNAYHDAYNLLPLDTTYIESYRLIVNYAFDYHPESFHITRNKHGVNLYYQEFPSEWSEGIKHPEGRRSSVIREKDWKRFKTLLKDSCFWTLPIITDRSGFDGYTYTLEAFNSEPNPCTGQQYHVVSRWAPTPGAFRSICDTMISFAIAK